jgi:hypothetical protein
MIESLLARDQLIPEWLSRGLHASEYRGNLTTLAVGKLELVSQRKHMRWAGIAV